MELDRKTTETAIVSGLPAQARWMINGTPLDFDFSVAGHGLRRLPDEAIEAGDVEASDLLLFGEQDFAEGGGACPWLCVRKRDGSVYGFDPERDKPMFLLNTSIERFIATFRLLDEHLGSNAELPSDCESRLRAIDPDAYRRSDWRSLVECLRKRQQP
jgi:SUKH-4 immunity protein